MPIAYSNIKLKYWESLHDILEAAYEATLLTTVINAERTGSNIVYLTLLVEEHLEIKKNWIYQSIERAINLIREYNIDLRIVSYGIPQTDLVSLLINLNKKLSKNN